jgi:hypothetical protein
MQPNEALTEQYDLLAIGGEALRQAGKKQVCQELASVFANPDSGCVEITLTSDLRNMEDAAKSLIRGDPFGPDMTAQISPVYDSFTQEGVTYESRITRLHMPCEWARQSDFVGANAYMLSLLAEGSTSVGLANCRFGVVVTDDGQRELFRVDKNENQGKPIHEAVLQYVESERVLAAQGRIDNREIIAERLTPADEQLVVEEFKKAVSVISGK